MTINEIQDLIISEFASLDDWLDKYEHLIKLGQKHPGLKKKFKNDDNALFGCQSQVWVKSEIKDGKLYYYADSDSMITRGILALLIRVLNSQTPSQIIESELYFQVEIGLSSHLSPSRANGMKTITNHFKQLAKSRS